MFQSTRPARGATPRSAPVSRDSAEFQSTRPARGATPASLPLRAGWDVSIHAPRAGRDRAGSCHPASCCVSIHAPRAGRDKR